MPDLAVKRVYEPVSSRDGRRILVDRVWPRGMSKKKLGDILWLKEIAPSAQLRKWFGHKAERWPEFRKRYFAELRTNRAALALIRAEIKRGRATLLYSARDTEHNQAIALAEFLKKGARRK